MYKFSFFKKEKRTVVEKVDMRIWTLRWRTRHHLRLSLKNKHLQNIAGARKSGVKWLKKRKHREARGGNH
jgi:hypothetical protein